MLSASAGVLFEHAFFPVNILKLIWLKKIVAKTFKNYSHKRNANHRKTSHLTDLKISGP